MISLKPDTHCEYHGGHLFGDSQTNMKTNRRLIHLIVRRSCVQHHVCLSGVICLKNGGISE